MKFTGYKTIIALATIVFSLFNCYAAIAQINNSSIPHLIRQDNVVQLFVDDKPFIILGGELNNSSSSSLTYMQPIWKQVKSLNFNTLLTPLSWEQIEPQEGQFDFSLVDSLISNARQNNLHLVFLWLASWKNGMSSYPPVWVKRGYKKYKRAVIQNGQTQEVLSTFCEANRQADAAAFGALMKHIREFDGKQHTVLMMQVENEVGILGDSRDRSDAANAAFNAPVPQELITYLVKNKENLVPEIKSQWAQSGFKTSGKWEEVFGKGPDCDKLFMAWNYSGYVNEVAAAGKKEYPIPMYANAWLDGGNAKPGDFPSGGPLASVMDIWKAQTTAVDLFAPDLYASDYDERCQKFTQRGNTLFIPEMNSSDDGARNVFIAIGKYNGIGVSPFGIDHLSDADKSLFTKSYSILQQLSPFILKEQLKKQVAGFIVDEKTPVINYEMNGYRVEISLDELFGHRATIGYGVVMADGPGSFIGGGSGFRVRFFPLEKGSKSIIGIDGVTEGTFNNGEWVPGRRLNGDEDDQGRAWRFASWQVGIEKCSIYKYE